MQTELMCNAGATQKFTANVCSTITSRDKDLAEKKAHQATRVMRLNNAVQFLQVADRKLAEEQNTWNTNCESWAWKQQRETERLAKEQQKLRTEVSVIERVTTMPSYLQSALP